MKFAKADKGTSAAGFSGAGIWFPVVQPPNAIIWRPRLGLAGIQSIWYKSRLLTQAVKVERIVRFLSRVFGTIRIFGTAITCTASRVENTDAATASCKHSARLLRAERRLAIEPQLGLASGVIRILGQVAQCFKELV
jgi:hypothetical protein